VQLADALRWRGNVVVDVAEERRRRDAIDALLQRSEPAFPCTTQGL
jgi:hypothetical protein